MGCGSFLGGTWWDLQADKLVYGCLSRALALLSCTEQLSRAYGGTWWRRVSPHRRRVLHPSPGEAAAATREAARARHFLSALCAAVHPHLLSPRRRRGRAGLRARVAEFGCSASATGGSTHSPLFPFLTGTSFLGIKPPPARPLVRTTEPEDFARDHSVPVQPRKLPPATRSLPVCIVLAEPQRLSEQACQRASSLEVETETQTPRGSARKFGAAPSYFSPARTCPSQLSTCLPEVDFQKQVQRMW
ncbi:beta-catenin-interacting protein 1 isoform X1 [Hippopotamus amphibius kiboko]|uniref:beta-catenin-interacting protein 1 isoform X1 n=1 Tax=Hippopotamus amphibius kiboko TaxID=575201 RepID=UPI00259353AE|nr:beta-catenin-interacting protein 1 isoform X1 [Hippopotamus amphibius kiboko]